MAMRISDSCAFNLILRFRQPCRMHDVCMCRVSASTLHYYHYQNGKKIHVWNFDCYCYKIWWNYLSYIEKGHNPLIGHFARILFIPKKKSMMMTAKMLWEWKTMIIIMINVKSRFRVLQRPNICPLKTKNAPFKSCFLGPPEGNIYDG